MSRWGVRLGESAYKSWKEEAGSLGHIPPEAVFYLEEGDTEETWKKLYRFATRCKTLDVDRSIKNYPIDWKYLRELLYHLLYEREVVVFKVRQILMTWSLAVLFLWETMAFKNNLSVFISLQHDAAKEFLSRRVLHLYNYLPVKWKDTARLRRPTMTKFELDNNSRILALSSRSVGGRSFTLNRAAIDEAGYIQHVRDLKASLEPALGETGKLCIGSTPHLMESDFEQIVYEAEQGNGAKLLRFPIGCRPERDKAWQEKMKPLLGKDWDTEYGLMFAVREENALFPAFDHKVHVVYRRQIEEMYGPAKIWLSDLTPEEKERGLEGLWPTYAAIDPHTTKPTAMLYMAVLPDNTWYFFDEAWIRGDVRNVAKQRNPVEESLRVVERVIDPLAETEYKSVGAPSIRSRLRDSGYYTHTAERSRTGIDELQARMVIGGTGRPRVFIDGQHCGRFVRQLRSASCKTENEVLKGRKWHFIDLAKYIANCRPVFDQTQYKPPDNEKRDAMTERILRDLVQNVRDVRQANRGFAWKE